MNPIKQLITNLDLLIGVSVWLLSSAALATGLDASIIKHQDGQWEVSYKANKPIERIAFVRNPDASRVERWKVLEEGLTIRYEEGKEYIVSRDGSLFQRATVYLTPSYKHLSKDYAPFSPFSDGGSLFHSGRLFACENQCADELNEWRMTITVPRSDHIILDGKLHETSISWLDSSDGRNIYVGRQKPLSTNRLMAIVDSGLPKEIRTSLEEDIPKMFDYLERKLGKLPTEKKPSLFASYAKVKGTSTQGGALPNQIFIHWNRNDLEERVGDEEFLNSLLWTFAHEAGHLYQQSSEYPLQSKESWIHEGHAEMVAFDTLQYLYPQSGDFLANKIGRFKQHCASGLGETSLLLAAENGRFPLYYSCGFFIHQAIENVIDKVAGDNHSAYRTWNLFKERIDLGENNASIGFLEAVTEISNQALANEISHFVDLQHEQPAKAIEKLLQEQ